jgi:hypothetical protein
MVRMNECGEYGFGLANFVRFDDYYEENEIGLAEQAREEGESITEDMNVCNACF